MAYIDKEKFLKKNAECFGHFGVLVKAVEEIAEECTDKDVLKVVRCKDCKFNVANMEKDPLDITDYSGDDIVCSYFMTDGLGPNDYCSKGTRTPKERGGEK